MKKVIILDCGPSLEEVTREFGQSPEWIISALADQDCEIDWIKAYAGQTMETVGMRGLLLALPNRSMMKKTGC